MLKKLIKLANHLDSKKLSKEADYLDKIIEKYSQMSYSEYSKMDDSKKDDSKRDPKINEVFGFDYYYKSLINQISKYEGDGKLGFGPSTAKELKEEIDKFIVNFMEHERFTPVVQDTLRQAREFIDEENKEYYEANRERSPQEKRWTKI